MELIRGFQLLGLPIASTGYLQQNIRMRAGKL